MSVRTIGRQATGACIALLLVGCGGPMPQFNTVASVRAAATRSPQLEPPKIARYRVVFDFGTASGSCASGVMPFGSLAAVNEVLYGTTYGGGQYGEGAVFSLTAHGAEHVIYSFNGQDKYGNYGGGSEAGMLAIGNRLYGTTAVQGAYDAGTAFEVRADGNERWSYSFGATADASMPQAKLVALNGTLYGTTSQGGAYGEGAVYSIAAGTGQERVVYSFRGAPADGRQPQADLLADSGALYGTTTYGGAHDDGTVFTLDPKTGKERLLHAFSSTPDGLDPQAGMIAADGTLYGTTAAGGVHDEGAIFSITLSGNENILYSFGGKPDGQNPRADLLAVNGTLYGTTAQGGSFYANGPISGGTLFSYDIASGRERVLHSFGGGADGAYPAASLLALGRKLYGTTIFGGPNFSWCVTSGGNTLGTVFSWSLQP